MQNILPTQGILNCLYLSAVYVHVRANVKLAMAKLHNAICKQKNKHPESIFIVAGNFDHLCLKTVLPKFY